MKGLTSGDQSKDIELEISKLSVFKTTAANYLSRINGVRIGQTLRKMPLRRLFKFDVNPIVKLYSLPQQWSILLTTWRLLVLDAIVNVLYALLGTRLVLLLVGMLTRVYIDSGSRPISGGASDSCPSLGSPYSLQSNQMESEVLVRSIFERTIKVLLSAPGQACSVLLLLALLSFSAKPNVSEAMRRKVHQWHFDQQVSLLWKMNVRSKFDFNEEAQLSVSLMRAMGSLLALALIAAYGAIKFFSPVYLVSFVGIVSQFLMIIFVPSANDRQRNRDVKADSALKNRR